MNCDDTHQKYHKLENKQSETKEQETKETDRELEKLSGYMCQRYDAESQHCKRLGEGEFYDEAG